MPVSSDRPAFPAEGRRSGGSRLRLRQILSAFRRPTIDGAADANGFDGRIAQIVAHRRDVAERERAGAAVRKAGRSRDAARRDALDRFIDAQHGAVHDLAEALRPAGLLVRMMEERKTSLPRQEGMLVFFCKIRVSRGADDIATLSITALKSRNVKMAGTYFGRPAFDDEVPLRTLGTEQVKKRVLQLVAEAHRLSHRPSLVPSGSLPRSANT